MQVRVASVLSMSALLLFSIPATPSLATSEAGVSLREPFPGGQIASDSQINTTTPAIATLNGVVGRARTDLAVGLVGAGLELPAGSPSGFYDAYAAWFDTWTGGSVVGNVPLAASITLRGSIDTSLLAFSDPFWEIQFSYVVGVEEILGFSAFGDSTVPVFRAAANGDDISSSIVFGPNPTNPLLTDFTLVANPTVSVSSTGFSDYMILQLRSAAGGPLTLDMYHTVSVQLTSLDPSTTFTGEGGRTIASVPEPGTLALLAAGLGAVGWRQRRTRG